jgi:choline dehydrogenase-like flavoprotein
MPVIDARSIVPEELDCDVCIIGSGPAGSTVARELSTSRLRVTVLESGGFDRRDDVDALNEIESVGWPRVADQWMVRNRIIGGSSHTWTGRCAPFDEIDLHRRDWIPHSGWPFSISDLTPYLDRSARYLGLGIGTGFSDDGFWSFSGHEIPTTLLDPETLLPIFWQYSRDVTNPYDYMRFGKHLPTSLGPNVAVMTYATVIRIDTVESGTAVKSVVFATIDGRIRTLNASTVVVCAGGIENARLLLVSRLGNDLVGRFLMDHPRGTVARFRSGEARAALKRFGFRKAKAFGHNLFQLGMRLSPTMQRNERLLNCAAWINETIAEDDPWNALKRFLRGKADLRNDMVMILGNTGLFARGLKDYFVLHQGLPRKAKEQSLDCMVEQWPDPDSRVTLSNRRDRFGIQLPRIDWRVHEEEARAMRRMAEVAVAQFERMNLGTPRSEAWVQDGALFPSGFVDVAHPSGTTRMANDPASGVVDAECQVHGVEGLFVAGSSIFPTNGHCNPTQMIVALALRLADKLKARQKDLYAHVSL